MRFLVKVTMPPERGPGPEFILSEDDLGYYLQDTDLKPEPGAVIPETGETTSDYAGVEGKVKVQWSRLPDEDES